MLAARAYPDETLLRIEDVDLPTLGPHDVLVKVAAAGLSPLLADFARLASIGILPVPTTLGHEAAGTVEQVGDDVVTFAPGDRVRIHANLGCRNCEYCRTDREQMCHGASLFGGPVFGQDGRPLREHYRDGALAEFARTPDWLLDPLPAAVSFEVGAKVHTLANALRALKLSALDPGATLVVTAATGNMGAATIRLASLFGVTRLIAVARSRERLDALQSLVDQPVDAVALEELDEGWEEAQGLTEAIGRLAPSGVHSVVDYFSTGAGTWQAIAALRTGGTAAVMGINYSAPPMPTAALVANCWRIVGTRSCTRSDTRQIIDLLATGRLVADDLITHRYPLQDINKATAALRERREPMWMAIAKP
ncbi:Alcohol dehydrogenase [Baekduia alba]|uniref:zinc-dependent alcohol dehydrogenase n=1 Tax=Baekduia alba TaxID=2997333 RepID=UPI00233FCCF0|nr:alcohol dehydrogenase catalytic domain-containing protein [Baekduia alba]WCB92096.1 Alcohol dehydrogenase [Baekduia alba]